MAFRGTAKRHDDEQGREEDTRSKTSSDDCNLVRSTVRSRNDEEIFEDTKKPKIRCLNLWNVEGRYTEGKVVENDPTFIVTNSQLPRRETRQAVKTHQHDYMKYFTDAEERAIATNSAAVSSTLVARTTVKKISA